MDKQIHWFPGHMKKALDNISAKIKLVDIIIEIIDARAPLSSINEDFEKLIINKKKLIIVSKSDMSDPVENKKWENYLNKKYDKVLFLNLSSPKVKNEISKAVTFLGEDKRKKDMAKGMKPQPLKVMIIGIPNVGKSTLINTLASRHAAGVENKPGFTRGEQFIKVNNDFILLDTPGVLPTSYEDKNKATKLALIGSIRSDILPNSFLVDELLKIFSSKYPSALVPRFGINNIINSEETLKEISKKRHILKSNNEIDILKAENLLLNEFKDGKLGLFTLEFLEDKHGS